MADGHLGRILMPGVPHAGRSPHLAGDRAGRSFLAGSAARPIHVVHIAAPAKVAGKTPVVMVHGACHTGACYLSTPDGREGWAPLRLILNRMTVRGLEVAPP